MKERLAQWFLLVAKRLDPSIEVENHRVVENYEQKKVGLTYVITKKDIKEYRYKDGARMSAREGERCIVSDTKRKIRSSIISAIDRYRLIEYNIVPNDSGFVVTGCMNVCAKIPNGKDGKSESNTDK